MHEPTQNSRLLRVAIGAAILYSAASYVVITWQTLRGETTFDDAYMFLRYAQNFLAGHGLAWNAGGPQVFGCTSLLHLGIVALLMAATPLQGSTLLVTASSTMGLVAFALMVYASGRFAARGALHRRYWVWAGVLGPALLTRKLFLMHATTGMDTMLAMACNCLVVIAAFVVVENARALRVCLLVAASYLAFLARPDNGIYATCLPGLAIMLLCPRTTRWRTVALFGAGIGLLLGLDAVAKTTVFGSPLPLSYYAKKSGHYAHYANGHCWNPVRYLQAFFTEALPFLCILLLCVRRKHVRLLTVCFAPVAMTFAYYFAVTQIMGTGARFYYPAMPFFVVASTLTLADRLADAQTGARWPGYELAARAAIIMVVCTLGPIVDRAAGLYGYLFIEDVPLAQAKACRIRTRRPLPDIGWWRVIKEMGSIARQSPVGSAWALTEHGYVGASAPQVEMIDLVGLHDPEFAHNGFSASELFRRQPDLIWGPHADYSAMLEALLASDEFWRDYIYIVGAFDQGIALRRSSPHFARLLALVEASWRTNYAGYDMADYIARPVQ